MVQPSVCFPKRERVLQVESPEEHLPPQVPAVVSSELGQGWPDAGIGSQLRREARSARELARVGRIARPHGRARLTCRGPALLAQMGISSRFDCPQGIILGMD